MKEKTLRKQSRIMLLSALLLVAICTLIIGTAYGRYQRTESEIITLEVRNAATFELLGSDENAFNANGWIQEEDGSQTFTFYVSNGGDSLDSYYYLNLATTLGFQADGAKITLIVENANGIARTYESTAEKFATDSVLYEEMGAGYVYRFLDSDQKEIKWKLDGGKLSKQKFTVKIEGASQASLMEVIITEAQQGE